MRWRTGLIGALIAGSLAAAVPVVVLATGAYPDDSYYTANIGTSAPSGIGAATSWVPMGDHNLSSTGAFSGFSPALGNAYQVTTAASYSGGWAGGHAGGFASAIAANASSYWPCCQHGQVSTGAPSPFSSSSDAASFDALNLNGGVVQEYGNTLSVSGWTVCMWFAVNDNQGAIVMATGMQTNGLPSVNALVLATGTIGNLVLYQFGNQTSPAISETYAANGSWTWACVTWNSSTLVATLTGFNSTTAHNVTFSTGVVTSSNSAITNNTNSIWMAGDIEVYGYEYSPCAPNCLTSTWVTPTNPSASGGGSIGSPSGGGTSCAQVGIVSGNPKLQWCYPQLGCNTIDLSWTNIANDFSWLGCVVEQAVLAVVGSIVNVGFDLVIPSSMSASWSGLWTTMQTHVPFCYLTGAWSAISGILGASALTPTFTATIPYGDVGHGSTSTSLPLTMDVAGMLAPMVPWRGAITGFMVIWTAMHIYSITRNRLSAGVGEEHYAGNDAYWSE